MAEEEKVIKHLTDAEKVQHLDEQSRLANIEKGLILEKMLKSNNAQDIFKAQGIIRRLNTNRGGSNEAGEGQVKSMLIDPYALNQSMGYAEKQFSVSYQVLRNMGKVPVMKAIIGTRVEQVVDFLEPQRDRHSTGFVIRPKRFKPGEEDKEKLTKAEEKEVEQITEFLLNCGTPDKEWHGDTLETLIRKFIPDCLTLDQGTFETVRNNMMEPQEVIATDGATFRIADSWDDDIYTGDKEEIDGHYPSYVQVWDGRIIADFYPWELCFGIRNPQSSIYANGYGRSEMEDLIQTVTSILHADQYNANYFKLGSNPKGILKVSGNVNTSRIEELKGQWSAQMAGVANAHKMPVIEADKLDFINTQASNKDMEYSKYYEFLIKIGCAVYKLDPSEIGFPLPGSSTQTPMFEGNNAQRLQFSKDKGLKPLLKFVQRQLNKYIVSYMFDGKYEIVFAGLDAETAEQELEADIKKMGAGLMTLETGLAKYGHKFDSEKDILLNPVYLQYKQMAQMGGEESNEYMDENYYEEEEDNPFEKAFQESWDILNNEES